MTLRDIKDINTMRWYYYLWFTVFYSATIIVGLLCRVLLSNVDMFNAELALPQVTLLLLPGPMVGVVLAALFAATMSTADSLIIACTSAVGCDIVPGKKDNLYFIKFITLMIVLAAIFIAISDNQTVFRLVLDAWGLLGSAFVPLITVKTFRWPCRQWRAVGMLCAGSITFAVWSRSPLNEMLYAAAPGILAGFLFYYITGKLTQKTS